MTLEKSKSYGLEQAQTSLHEKARTRLIAPTPHQAPQRERVSQATSPKRGRPRSKGRPWKEKLSPDVNMGVPTLMLILEPMIVWDHVKAYIPVLGKEVEASISPGEFFEGWHKKSRLANGVYEGNYWELLGDCDELIDMLKRLSRAPALIPEPVLQLPPQPEPPKWDEFKPNLQAIPTAPEQPPLKLPAFHPPMLETELPFVEPELLPVPNVPDAAQEDQAPPFVLPELYKIEPFEAPDFQEVEPPVIQDPPKAPRYGQPKHGADWTGTRPYLKDEPDFVEPPTFPERAWVHPPRNLPTPIDLPQIKLETIEFGLEPRPLIELAWQSGPDPEPAYASVATTPKIRSRSPSPPATRKGTPSPPGSPLPPKSPASPSPPRSPPSTSPNPTRPSSAKTVTRPSSARASPKPDQSAISPWAGSSPPPSRRSSRPRSATPKVTASRQRSTPSPPPPVAAPTVVPTTVWQPLSGSKSWGPSRRNTWMEDLNEQWGEVADVDSGRPRVWLNFFVPFKDLPPVFLPPKPKPPPEPLWEDYKPMAFSEASIPPFVAPVAAPLPVWKPHELVIPRWCPPCEPGPIGFLRGHAPILLLDVSGTMNPRQRGKFKQLKGVVCELLDPKGELATAAEAFDVINFCSGAWSWSDNYENRLALMASSQVMYSGRQQGRVHTARKHGDAQHTGHHLQPTEPDLIEDARNWVAKWPEAVGATCYMAGFNLADQHWAADCWYIFSDGLAHDMSQVLDFLESRIRNNEKVPMIHTVGFLPDDLEDGPGERFLRKVSDLTGGTFVAYRPDMLRVFEENVGFVHRNLKDESPADRTEREWAEAALRAERRKNVRLGITETMEATIARVKNAHQQLRVKPTIQEHETLMTKMRREYEETNTNTLRANKEAQEQAVKDYAAMKEDFKEQYRLQVEQAKAVYDEAVANWTKAYEDEVKGWEDVCAVLERQREDALLEMAADDERMQAEAKAQAAQRAAAEAAGGDGAQNAPKPAPVPSKPAPRAKSAGVPKAKPWSPVNNSGYPPSAYPKSDPSGMNVYEEGDDEAANFVVEDTSSVISPFDMENSGFTQQANSRPTSGIRGLPQVAEDSGIDDEGGEEYGQDEPIPPMRGSKAGSEPRSPARAGSRPGTAGKSRMDGTKESGTHSRPGTAGRQRDEGSLARAGSQPGMASRPKGTREQQLPRSRVSTPGNTHDEGRVTSPGTLQGATRLGSSPLGPHMQKDEVRQETQRTRSSPGNFRDGVELSASGYSQTVPLTGPSSLSPARSAAAANKIRPASARTRSDDLSRPMTALSEMTVKQVIEAAPDAMYESGTVLAKEMYPVEVVRAVEDENEEKLARIREEWEELSAGNVARNKAKMQQLERNKAAFKVYEDRVVFLYAESFTSAMLKSAIALAANDDAMEAAQASWRAKVEEVRAINDHIASLHTEEVAKKVAKDQEYYQSMQEYEEKRRAILDSYEIAVVAARRAHKEAVAVAQADWDERKALVERMNEENKVTAMMAYERLLEQIKEINRQHRIEHMELVKMNAEVEHTNKERMAAARERHREKMEELALLNERRLVEAQEDHVALCERLSLEHEASVRVAQEQWEHLRTLLQARNETEMGEARKRYAQAMDASTAKYERECAAIRQAYQSKLEHARRHNEEVWPQVQIARIAQMELARVMVFAEHIRFCANKFEVGLNLLPNTPNYDRVVEMQALTEALGKAFFDMSMKELPWPDHERKLQSGTGWTPSPQPKSCMLKDPGHEIDLIAMGRIRPRSARPAVLRVEAPTETANAEKMELGDDPESPVSRPILRPSSAGHIRLPKRADFAVGGPALNKGPSAWMHISSTTSSPGPPTNNNSILRPLSASRDPGASMSRVGGSGSGVLFPQGSPSAAVRARLIGGGSPVPANPHRPARLALSMPSPIPPMQARTSSMGKTNAAFLKEAPRVQYPDVQIGVFSSMNY